MPEYAGCMALKPVPDMSGRKLSTKQKEVNERMQMAITAAKAVVGHPKLKLRACEMLQVEPNKVFRAVVKQFLLTDGNGGIFEETEQEKLDKQTLAALTKIINTEIPNAEITLFGDRARGAYDASGDWDILVLTATDYPQAHKWELQDKLFQVTIQQGTRVNILLVQRTKWYTEPEYQVLRKRIEAQLPAASAAVG